MHELRSTQVLSKVRDPSKFVDFRSVSIWSPPQNRRKHQEETPPSHHICLSQPRTVQLLGSVTRDKSKVEFLLGCWCRFPVCRPGVHLGERVAQ